MTQNNIPKVFKIKFCWAQSTPFTIIFNGKEMTVSETNEIKVIGEPTDDISNIIKKLSGTNLKIISNINSISLCQC